MGAIISLYNNSFFSKNLYVGSLYINFDKNRSFADAPNLANKNVTYRLTNGDGDDDNDRFEIIGNNLYNKPQYKQDETKKIYKVLVIAEFADQSSIKQNFEIFGYQPTTGYSPIVSIYTQETKFIEGLLISPNWTYFWQDLTIDNKPNGQVRLTERGIYYTASNLATDDNVLLNSNNQPFIGLFFQVFDENRIQNLAKEIGTFKFKNSSYDIVSKNWTFGNFKIIDFFIFNESYVFGQAGYIGMIFFNE